MAARFKVLSASCIKFQGKKTPRPPEDKNGLASAEELAFAGKSVFKRALIFVSLSGKKYHVSRSESLFDFSLNWNSAGEG